MCGIAGFLSTSAPFPSEANDLLKYMNDRIAHRGPDGSGVWFSEHHKIGFAHRRLSIVDLSQSGKQPMMDSEGTVVISFNGEIYNHLELRKELEESGFTYRSNTDTETILYAYKKWGIDCIEKFEGMFAFALYDLENRVLHLVRDRIGIKPLYFSMTGGHLSFASEIKALWKLPWMRSELNDLGIYHYLTFMAAPAPMTIFKGVYKLPAGFRATLNATGSLNFQQWYSYLEPSVTYNKKELEDESFCVEHVRELMRASVKRRMMADVPVGALLSGGVDSSFNVALMSELSNNIKTFNVAFEGTGETDERHWASKVSKIFGTQHHEILINEHDAAQALETIFDHQDEPLADPVCIPIFFLSQLVKQHGVTVVQVGEGADELFCGYPMYARALKMHQRFWTRSKRIVPNFAKRMASRVFTKVFSDRIGWKELIYNWAHDRELFWGGAVAFPETMKQDFFTPHSVDDDEIVKKIFGGLTLEYDSHAIPSYHLATGARSRGFPSFLDSMIHLELKQRLPELLLMRVDKMTMASSLEGRVPFLDHHLVEFALQIPAAFKFRGGVTKHILKQACRGILPDDVIFRKKVGFAAPVTGWFRHNGPIAQKFNTLISSDVVSKVGSPREKIKRLTVDHMSKNRSLQLWALHNLFGVIQGTDSP